MESHIRIFESHKINEKQFYAICDELNIPTIVFRGDIVECEAWIRLHDAGYLE